MSELCEIHGTPFISPGRCAFCDEEASVDNIIAQLGELDRDLLLGRCEGWGSWMSISGSYMVSLGLGTRRDGSISFDTPLAKAVIARLSASQGPTYNERD